MSNFGFMLRFLMPSGKIVPEISGEDELPLGLSDLLGQVAIRRLPPRPNCTPSPPERYEVRGSGFQSMEMASACGKRIKQALAVVGCELDCGIDVGNDRSTSGASLFVKDMFRDKFCVKLRDNIHGLDVFEEGLPVSRMEMSGTMTVTSRVEGFLDRLYDLYQKGILLTEKKVFALAFYNSTLFENSTQVRFLNLITVVEILSQRCRVSQNSVDLLGRMHSILREATLTHNELRSLTNGLHNLKRISIGESCKGLVSKHLGRQPGEYFARCYRVRSDLVHNGRTSTPERINPTELGQVVKQVLLAELQTT